jgi:hypothetical protein
MGEAVADRVRARLDADDDRVSWFAAGICAAWGDPAAEQRLLRAVRNGEWGFDEEKDRDLPYTNPERPSSPMNTERLAPNWLTALRMVGLCGGRDALETLSGFAADADHSLDTRLAVALSVELLAGRGEVDADAACTLLDRLPEGDIPGRVSFPHRKVSPVAEYARGGRDVEEVRLKQGGRPNQEPEDHIWQLHLVIARARLALGREPQAEAAGFLHDERGFVRRAFAEVLGDR